MNGYQRVMTAMKRGQPDRVPVVEYVIDPKVRAAICPTARDVSDLIEFLDMDMVGCPAEFVRVKGDDREFVDEWGVRYRTNTELVPHPVEGPLRTMDDVRRYRPPDPDAPGRLGQLPDLVRRFKGKRAIIFHHRAAFMWSCYLMGIENLLMAMAEEPELVEALFDKVADVNERICRNAVRAGADLILLGDDYASNTGPFCSPAHFRQLALPRLKRVIGAIHEEGGLVIKHSDGNIWALLDMIVEAGADAINPLEPTAGMDIAKVKAQYGDKVCLVGNIDCGDLLSHGTTAEVEAAVKQCIADAGEGGGFILSSSNSIHSTVKPENFVEMVRAAHRWGRYPLDLK